MPGEFTQNSVLVAATCAFRRWPSARLAPRMLLPVTDVRCGLGHTGQAGPFLGQDEVVRRETIAEVRGRDLIVDRFSPLGGPSVTRAIEHSGIPRLQTGREVQT